MLCIAIHFNLEKGLVISLKMGGWKSDSRDLFYLESIFFLQGFIILSMQDLSCEGV